MSVTANSIIARAMRLIQVLGSDVNPTAQEAADGLSALNSMLDAWSIERLMVYSVQRSSYTWPASTPSRTIGSGGDFDASRPIRIEDGCFFRDANSQDYPVSVLPRQDYDSIVTKGVEGSVPEYLFFDDAFPTRTLFAYPVPTQELTLFLNSWKPLQQFTSLTSQISLPPGYQAAIEYSLACWIAPEFGAAAVAAANNLERRAIGLKQSIKAVNKPLMVAQLDYVRQGSGYNIFTDR